jgi:DNA-binding LacI/PurR family transcriptional regulator
MLYTTAVVGRALERAPTVARRSRPVSIRDVAAAAGVSVATVSRALGPNSDSVQMRPETRQRVLRVSEELGYRPNDLARALLRQHTSVVGLIVPDISNLYYAGLVRGVEDAASAAGYRVVLCNTDRDVGKLGNYLDTLVESRVDGVIIAGGATDSAVDSRVFRPYRTKRVMVGRHAIGGPSVQIDNVAAARQVLDHLLDLGHRRVAFLAGPFSSLTVQDRLAGYRDALAARGIGVGDDLMLEGDLTEESGYRGALELLSRAERPTAIVCANDRMAVGALAASADSGLAVPAQVSVAGFDDVSVSSYLRPRLTTVAIPTYEMGTAAAALLLDQLNAPGADTTEDDSAAPPVVMLPTTLVVRQSCAPPPRSPRRARRP